MTRYPFAPLAALMGCTEASAARRLNISGRTEQEYRREGMSEKVADRMAVRAGYHPFEVWPEMAEYNYIDYKDAALGRAKKRQRTVYLKDANLRSARRTTRRAYYETCGDYERAQQRRRYWADPEKARARRRERYARNREAEKARQAEYRARKRATVVGPLSDDVRMTKDAA